MRSRIRNGMPRLWVKALLVAISAAGDRRDEDIRRQTEILGDAFDAGILYQNQCQRGRTDGEVLALLRQGSRMHDCTTIEEICGAFLVIDTALVHLGPVTWV